GKQLVQSDVRQTHSETHAHQFSDTPMRDFEGSAHTDTYTALLNHIADRSGKFEFIKWLSKKISGICSSVDT
ncbi:hypothetical protein ACR2XN_28170, partial [Klebsiella pneumoniae]